MAVNERNDPLEILVNGRSHRVVADSDTPLLYVLRNELALNSVRFGCGLSRCGACTIHLDGEPVRSCELPVGEVIGRQVVTLEGLGTPHGLHPLQQAFLNEQAGQCGYCLPGIVMTAAHLLARNRQPAEAEIREALRDTLCRCGAHGRMVRAIQRAAGIAVPAPEPDITLALAGSGNGDAPLASSSISHSAGDVAESIDARLGIAADGQVTIYTGKVELGTGVRTALAQIVANALDVPVERITMVMGDTRLTPDDGGTIGSKTLQHMGPRLQRVAAEARRILMTRAAARIGVPVEQVQTREGVVCVIAVPSRSIPYGELAAEPFCLEVRGGALWQAPNRPAAVGRSIPRVDLRPKLTGGEAFVHDLRLPGMLHGRVVRPHVRTSNGIGGATVQHVDDRAAHAVPGIVAIVRNGSFVGVVAEREEQAIRAAAQLRVAWSEPEPLPDQRHLHASMLQMPAQTVDVASAGDVDAAFGRAARIVEATYAFPIQAHASLGPSCAVADVRVDGATIHSSSQHVFGLRAALAPLLGLPVEQVHVIHREGSGCYGHNGADDVSADAAILSQAVGRPVRVQWERADEFAWEPKGPAMLSRLRGGLDSTGEVVAWEYDVWTPTHVTRPGGEPSRLLAAQLVDPPLPAAPLRWVGGDRNAIPSYAFLHQRITAHWIDTPLRQGSLRSLGGMANTTAIESFIDELAAAAGADPVAFRLRHLTDPRAVAVIRRAAEVAGWDGRRQDGKTARRPVGESQRPPANSQQPIATGRGIAFSRYESRYAYVAVVAEVTVERGSGAIAVTRVVVAHDCGAIVNPDGLLNQIEGNVIQGISRALKEEVTFDHRAVMSLTWMTYPILTFPDVPAIEVALVDRPDEPPWGAGEPAICPVAAAIGNAVFDATGVRLRAVPFTRVSGGQGVRVLGRTTARSPNTLTPWHPNTHAETPSPTG